MLRKSFNCASLIYSEQIQQTSCDQQTETCQNTFEKFKTKLKRNNLQRTNQIVQDLKVHPNLIISGQSLSLKNKLNSKKFQEKQTQIKNKRNSCLEFAKQLLSSKAKLQKSVTLLNRSRKRSEEEIDDKQSYQVKLNKLETPTKNKFTLKTFFLHKSPTVKLCQEEQSDELYYIQKLCNHKINQVKDKEPEEAKIFRQHFVQTFAILQYFNQMNINEETVNVGQIVNILKPKQKKNLKTLLLDLDETLIHLHDNSQIKEYIVPYQIAVQLPDQETKELLVSFRPGLHYFLNQLSKLYEIVIFTAGFKEYAEQILKFFEQQVVQQSGLYDEILARNECQLVQGQFYVKDLRCLLSNDRTLDNILIVDNACCSFALQLDNGIPCIPYYGGDNDKELYSLLNYLKQLANSDDIREVNRKTFHLSELVNEKDVESAYEKICKGIEQSEI